MVIAPIYRLVIDRILQTFALTATGPGLDTIGINYRVIRKPAEAAVFAVTIPAADGTIIPIGTDFTGEANGLIYFSNTSSTAAGGIATFDVTAQSPGSSGNLDVANTLTIGTQIPGAESIATITAIVTIGADIETDDVYRERVLSEIRTEGGGGNAADYRKWGTGVAGVKRVYPYSGDPDDVIVPPPSRTVYVEAETSIDPDGIPPQTMLDDVRDYINTDQLTSEDNVPLGITDDTLFVRPISRVSLFFEIRNLNVSASVEAQVKTEIETALESYSRGIVPYVPGIDSEIDRRDTITDLSVSDVVQDIIKAFGGTAEGVAFADVVDTSIPSYTLLPGKTAKSGGVKYVTT
jgi:uncharacterized phage protein gp47/JayE